MTDLIAGIDTGKKTGLAIWNTRTEKLFYVGTLGIIEAMEEIQHHNYLGNLGLVRFEDARLRKWFGSAGREKLQGVGSIKRDCSIWQEFCEYHNIPFEAVKPEAGQTKWKADYFKKVTGWQERTSEHSRDAALLVFGYKKDHFKAQ